MDKSQKRVAIIANIPAPYRERVYQIVSKNSELKVFYCRSIDNDREWKLKKSNYNSTILKSFTINYGETHLYFNFGIWSRLKRFNPDIIITNGFALPMLLGFFYTIRNSKMHGSFIDGTLITEKKLSFFHKMVRRFVFIRSHFFLGPSNETIRLFKSYGINERKIFKSCLAIDNEKFSSQIKTFEEKKYDLLFSGQFIDRKCPLFFTEIVEKLSKIKKDLKVVVIGSGPLEKNFIKGLKKTNAAIHFKGFVDQEDLPKIYSNSKILVMPTKEDCWGVVANEALASGCPVITTPHAGIANELIINNKTGYVIDLKLEEWIIKIDLLLKNKKLYSVISNNGIEIVKKYTYLSAAEGILNAIKFSQK